uniref:Putative mitochondrial DNA polymerase n=1 Tax=Rapaza viridis TaxID=1112050 RepID=A0A6F8QH97_9EUGL|nr:putative mitochondrial DNA polymerase [Rapaza viridis]
MRRIHRTARTPQFGCWTAEKAVLGCGHVRRGFRSCRSHMVELTMSGQGLRSMGTSIIGIPSSSSYCTSSHASQHMVLSTWVPKGVTIVQDLDTANRVMGILMGMDESVVFGVDTEIEGIELSEDSPWDQGEITCVSIYCGDQADFGTGPRLWIDALDGASGILDVFAPFFASPNKAKVYHNYSFDKAQLSRYYKPRFGADWHQGFHADTMHLARLEDPSRASYALDNLSTEILALDEVKVGMKDRFAVPTVKKDNTLSKRLALAPISELQRDPKTRCEWIDYSCDDAKVTWKLFQKLKESVIALTWEPLHSKIEGKGKNMWDLYCENWQPFGEILTCIEETGVFMNTEFLKEMSIVASEDLKQHEEAFRQWVYDLYCWKHGEEFAQTSRIKNMNIHSQTQLRQLIFAPCKKKNNHDLPEEMAEKKVFWEPTSDPEDIADLSKIHDDWITCAKIDLAIFDLQAETKEKQAKISADLEQQFPELKDAFSIKEPLDDRQRMLMILEFERDEALENCKDVTMRPSIEAKYEEAILYARKAMPPSLEAGSAELSVQQVKEKAEAAIKSLQVECDAEVARLRASMPETQPIPKYQQIAKDLLGEEADSSEDIPEDEKPEPKSKMPKTPKRKHYEEPIAKLEAAKERALSALTKRGLPILIKGLNFDTSSLKKRSDFTDSGWPATSVSSLQTLLRKSLTSEKNWNTWEQSGHSSNSSGPLLSMVEQQEAFKGAPEQAEAMHGAIDSLVTVAGIQKLLTGFIDPLTGKSAKGRIHPSLNLNTETGRLSCRRPNFQNIPALMKDQYRIRHAVRGEQGKGLIVADYSQLELRVMAQITNCEGMIDAFQRGSDIHSETAYDMYKSIQEHYGHDRVTALGKLKEDFANERKNAKTLNFAIAYGQTATGLAELWGVTKSEAQERKNDWFMARQEVQTWQNETIQFARENGYVRTLLGRRRNINPDDLNFKYDRGMKKWEPDQDKYNKEKEQKMKEQKEKLSLKNHLERVAMNTPIQGGAADIVAAAMLNVSENARLKELGFQMIMQVHDEIIMEGPEEASEEALELLISLMRQPRHLMEIVDFQVPLEVDGKCAKTWFEAK